MPILVENFAFLDFPLCFSSKTLPKTKPLLHYRQSVTGVLREQPHIRRIQLHYRAEMNLQKHPQGKRAAEYHPHTVG